MFQCPAGYPTRNKDEVAEVEYATALMELHKNITVIQSDKDEFCPPSRYPQWMQTLRIGPATVVEYQSVSHSGLWAIFFFGDFSAAPSGELAALTQHCQQLWASLRAHP